MIYLNTLMIWTTINVSQLKQILLLVAWNAQNIIEFISAVKVCKERDVTGHK